MRIIATMAAAMLLFTPLAGASAAGVTAESIEEMLSGEYNARAVNSNRVEVQVSGHVILVAIAGLDGDISFLTWLSDVNSGDVGYQFINKFNNEVKFGRAYLDSAGDVILQMDRNASGGVSAKNIESDFEVFLMLITKFLSDLESQAVA